MSDLTGDLNGYFGVSGLSLPTTNPFSDNGDPGKIRTPDLLVRSQTLYPTELQSHNGDVGWI